MRKLDLVDEVVKRVDGGVAKKVVSRVVNEVFEVMRDALERGDEVRVLPFGVFKVVERRARRVRNPRTGEVIELPARRVVKFRPGKELRESLG